jgi:putative transposase
MNHLKTYRFKLKPTKAQQQSFAQWVGTCRYVYNLALDTKIHAYKYGVSLSKYDLIKQLPDLKETEWIKEVHSQTLQDVVERLDKAYQSFFKGNGFPKFAKKGFYSSFTFKQGVKLHQNTNTVQLPKIGKVKYRKSQAVEGEIKTANVSKQADGWYISLACEVEIKTLPTNPNVVGLDVGIKSFVVTSDGDVYGNPKYLYHYQKRLTQAQRSVSRKKKGSSNRKKAVLKLAKLHLKVSNTRKDFQHQLSTRLIRENQTIVVENLQVVNLLKNHQLAKSISDCGWHQFTQMLEYKAKWYGRTFLKVAPHYTSQDCSVCGKRNSELTLADREWTCSCGVTHDRDVNASVNIKTKGVGSTLTACEIYSNIGSVAQESLAL